MDDELSKDIEDFFSTMRRYRLAVTPWVNRGMSRRGINLPQYTVLALLEETGEITMGRLAAKLGTTMGAATNLVDKLVSAALVDRKRSTEDRRIVTVKLSTKGRDLLGQAREDGKELLSDLFCQIPPADRRTFIEVQGKLANLLREKSEQRAQSDEVAP